MSSKTLSLSPQCLGNLPPNFLEQKITIILGQSEIKIPLLFACFLSPKISRMHQDDPILDTITISEQEATSELFTEDVKEIIKNLFVNDTIEINNEISYKLRIISLLFENDKMYQKISEIFPIITENNPDENQYLDYLLTINRYNYNMNLIPEYDDCLTYISKNFYKIDRSKLLQLPRSLLYSIITNPNLQLKNEDQLFDFVQEKFSKKTVLDDDFDIISFYEQINFSCLSEGRFTKFINEIEIDDISTQMWRQILPCFYCNFHRNNYSSHNYQENSFHCNYNGKEKDRFNGIIKHLTIKAGGNVHDKGVVIVTGKSYCHEINGRLKDREAKYAVDLDNKKTYFDSYISNQVYKEKTFIKYDFKNMKVRPNSYSIRSRPDHGKGVYNLASWVIEGCNDDSDEKNWVQLDSREDDHTLDYASAENNFSISS